MLYIGRLKELIDCKTCSSNITCKQFRNEKHLIWWPKENPVASGNSFSPMASLSAMTCSRGKDLDTKAALAIMPTIAMVRLHKKWVLVIPVKIGEDPSDIFTELVGWQNPLDTIRSIGKW